MIDRLPPQSLEAEQSVLGAVLIDRDAVVEVAEFLRPEDFYIHRNRWIYQAFGDLSGSQMAIDVLTVSDMLDEGRMAPASPSWHHRRSDGADVPGTCPGVER